MKEIEKLRQYGKKTIEKEKLADLFSAKSDEMLYGIVERLKTLQLIAPVASSKTNGNHVYPLYLKYKITLPKENYEAELEEIKKLHPALQSTGFLLKNPKSYQTHRDRLNQLSRYLFSAKEDDTPISRKERSFEIFGEEKVLDQQNFCGLLQKLEIDRERLAFYDTPEDCFPDYIPDKKENMTLLICENKDIWFNIRRRMYEDGARVIFDTPIDGVVYGIGNRVSANNSLTVYTDFFGGANVRYLYWGDIDRAGLNIYLSLKKANPNLQIELFIPAYEAMLRLAKGKDIPDSADRRERLGDYTEIFEAVDEEYRLQMEMSIKDNKRLPQEIISYRILREAMR